MYDICERMRELYIDLRVLERRDENGLPQYRVVQDTADGCTTLVVCSPTLDARLVDAVARMMKLDPVARIAAADKEQAEMEAAAKEAAVDAIMEFLEKPMIRQAEIDTGNAPGRSIRPLNRAARRAGRRA